MGDHFEDISMVYRDEHFFPYNGIVEWIIRNLPGAVEHTTIPSYEEKSTVIIMIDTNTRSVVPTERAYRASKSLYNYVLSIIGDNLTYSTIDYRTNGFRGADGKTYRFVTITAGGPGIR